MQVNRLTFSLFDIDDNQHQPIRDPELRLPKAAWRKVSRAIRRETELLNCPTLTLKTRWEQGMAACAVYRGEIVSYISRIPFFNGKKRERLAEILGISEHAFPQLDIMQSVTGWTRADWRKKGVYSYLNERLYESRISPPPLHVSYCAGLAASPTFIKLGWQLADWSKLPFVTSLGGWFDKGRMYILHEDLSKATAIKPYCGKPMTKEKADLHEWDQYCHFWTQDIRQIRRLERQLELLLEGNVSLWRHALKQALTASAVPPIINPASPFFIFF